MHGVNKLPHGNPNTNATSDQNGPINAPLVKGLKATSNGESNVVVPESIKNKAQVIQKLAKEGFPSVTGGAAEQGHAPPVSPEQKAYLDALAKYEAALEKHTAAIDQNNAIDLENKPLAEKAEFFDKMRESLLKVTTHGVAGDSYVSKQELTDLLASSDPAQARAAEFLLANWDAIPAPKYSDWGGGMNANEMRQWATTCGKEAESWRKQMKPHVPVPTHPGSPPPPPGTGQTSSSGSTGTTKAGSPTPTTGSEGAQGAKEGTQVTPDEFRARALANANKVPAFSSNATTGEGRMQDGLQHCQNKLEALQADLAEAAARGDQGAISLINAEIAKFQAGLSALMQMMKQQQEMQSNMSKMFNDMAMSALRNMR